MLRVTTIIQTAVLAGALVACGKSNPTEDLNLKTVPRQSDARPANKTERAALKFEIVGGVAPDLIEGKPGVVQLRVKADTFVSAYELTPVELPEGAELKRVDFENWELRWTPRNVVPAGQDAVTVQVTVEVSVVEVKDQRELPKPLRPEPIRLNVVKSAQKPVLVASQLERDTVRAGEFLPFTLTVRDSASNGSIAPKIEVLRSKAPDNKDKADGVPFVTMAAAPERLSDGNWRYTLVFDTREKQIPSVKKRGQVDESAEEVTACFDVRFQSQSKLSSAESPMCIRILHRAAKPELKWDEANAVVQVGKANTLNFSVTAPSSRGRLTLVNATDGFDVIAGSPHLKCAQVQGSKPVTQRCQLTWKIACEAAFSASYVIALAATHEVAQEKAEARLEREVKVEKTDRGCPPPKSEASTAAAKPAVKKPAAKKPAAKAQAKKPAAKKPAAKKPAPVKPAGKTAVAKKPTPKKPAPKTPTTETKNETNSAPKVANANANGAAQ